MRVLQRIGSGKRRRKLVGESSHPLLQVLPCHLLLLSLQDENFVEGNRDILGSGYAPARVEQQSNQTKVFLKCSQSHFTNFFEQGVHKMSGGPPFGKNPKKVVISMKAFLSDLLWRMVT